MAYKTILTVQCGAGNPGQMDAAIALARREDAHLEVLCLGVDRGQTGYEYTGVPAFVVQEAIDRAVEAAAALEAQVRARLAAEQIRWSVEATVAAFGGVSTVVGLAARFADLTVLSHPYAQDAGSESVAILEAALFEGGCPVLVVPPSGLGDDFERRALVAWNESDEALTAVRRALPLLKRAQSVEIAVVDPRPSGPERSDPGGALGQMLSRHGVRVEIAVLAKTDPKISEVLNRRARETGASLIVMGAYGHSRFREAILGGATRNMLQHCQVPVLMAH